jgi:hypothetical protein
MGGAANFQFFNSRCSYFMIKQGDDNFAEQLHNCQQLLDLFKGLG